MRRTLAEGARPFRLRTVEDPDPARWGQLIRSDPAAGPLHQPVVNRAVARGIAGARPYWLEVEDESGNLRAGMPIVERERWGLRQVVSGASGLYGGPVVAPECPEAATLLAGEFVHRGGLRTVRRELVWAGRDAPPGEWPGLRPLPTSILRISDIDADYEESLRPARRKERRRLLKSGYRVECEGPEQFLSAFFELYSERCRQWGSAPVPRSTLGELLECGPEWMAFVARADDGAVLGAHICIHLGTELFAWLGTTQRVEGGSLATLLIEEELRWCSANGCGDLNLGTSAGLGGVSEFKRGISAEEDPRWILRWQRGKGYR